MMATFLYAFNIHHSTVILPYTVSELDGGGMYSWTRVALVIAAICSAGLATIALRRFSFASCYLLGYALFVFGTLLCAVAQDMGQLLLGRILQGLGGGMLFTLGYVLMQVGVARAYWPLVLGLIQAMFAIGSIAAPMFSLAVVDVMGWRGQLLALGGLMMAVIVALAFQRRVLPLVGDESRERQTPTAQILLIASGIGLLTLATNASGWLLLSLCLAVLSTVALFVLSQRRTAERIVPKAAAHHGAVILAMAVVIVLYNVVFSVDLYTPKVLSEIGSLELGLGGFVVCIIPVSWAVFSVLATMAPGRSEHLLRLSLVTIFLGCGFYALTALGHRVPLVSGPLAIIMCMVMIGAGIGLGWPGVVSRMFASVEASEVSGVSRYVSLLQQTGTALGAVVVGIIARLSGDYAVVDGQVWSAVIMGAAFAAFSALALPLIFRAARP